MRLRQKSTDKIYEIIWIRFSATLRLKTETSHIQSFGYESQMLHFQAQVTLRNCIKYRDMHLNWTTLY